jgi:nicotinic acid mononucleotide adenylyltransferase
LAISSSEIRRELELGKRPAGVPPAVMQYILAHGLYGTGSTA